VGKYADGAYTVLRAIDLFDDRMLSSMRTTPVASFTAERPGSRKLEADFALFWQQSYFGELRSGILFGECKTFGVFEDKDVRRMRLLAKQVPGASLVFCTLRKSLTSVATGALYTSPLAIIAHAIRAVLFAWAT
jgi:hypothetical protein